MNVQELSECFEKIPERGFFFLEGGRGEPPYPPYHKKTRLSREMFLKKNLYKELKNDRVFAVKGS